MTLLNTIAQPPLWIKQIMEAEQSCLAVQEEDLDLQKDFAYQDLSEYDFSGMDLRGADFSYADLRKADFTYAELEDSNLSYAQLKGTQFIEDLFIGVSALSPDGTSLATDLRYGRDDGIRLWDTASGKLEHERIGHLCGVRCLLFHPQGHLLAGSNTEGCIRLWDVEDERLVQEMSTSSAIPVENLAFHPDGRLLAAADRFDARQNNTRYIHVWEIESGKLVWRLPGGAKALACGGPEGLLASARANGEIDLWNMERGEQLTTLSCAQFVPGEIKSLAFHPTNPTWLYVLLTEKNPAMVLLLDLFTGTLLGSLRGSTSDATQPGESAIKPSLMLPLPHDNRIVISGSKYGGIPDTFEIWDLLKGERQQSFSGDSDTIGWHIDSAGSQLVGITRRGHLAVIDLHTGKKRVERHIPACKGMNIFGVEGLSSNEHTYLLRAGAIEVEPPTREDILTINRSAFGEDHSRPKHEIAGYQGSPRAGDRETYTFTFNVHRDGRLSFDEQFVLSSNHGYAETNMKYHLTIPAAHVERFLVLLSTRRHLQIPVSEDNQWNHFLIEALTKLNDQHLLVPFKAGINSQKSVGKSIITLEQWLEQEHIPHKRATWRMVSVHVEDVDP